jgi:hypothetical protein
VAVFSRNLISQSITVFSFSYTFAEPPIMRYKVEFENNVPVRAIAVRSANRIEDLTEFGEQNGKTCIIHLCVEAENEKDAMQQAQRIVTTIFKF